MLRRAILIVEDDETIRNAVSEYLGMTGWDVTVAADGLQARSLLQVRPFDLVLSDIRMPGLDGHGLFAWIKQAGPGIPVVFMTAHGDADEGIKALKLGVADYLCKPFDLDELGERLSRVSEAAIARSRLTASGKPADARTLRYRPPAGALAEVYDLAEKVAATDSTVLIQGESGTGKEVLARFIHDTSPRRDGPFIAVNAGAIPQSLIESELFGHEKGAFSGADRRRIGHFESAQHGTIFLDEIGDLPLQLQSTLLRVLQERNLTRLGSSFPVPLDIRIITATNRDLMAMVADSSFRQDLYYRLQVVNLTLPPLRQRPEDIAGLCKVLLPKIAARLGLHSVPSLAEAALAKLQAYAFPGNIRELENLLERALILTGTGPVIDELVLGLPVRNLALPPSASPAASTDPDMDSNTLPPLSVSNEAQSLPAGYALNEWEAYAIKRALVHCGNNRTKAASLLGIGRRTLQQKIKEYWPDEAKNQT